VQVKRQVKHFGCCSVSAGLCVVTHVCSKASKLTDLVSLVEVRREVKHLDVAMYLLVCVLVVAVRRER
jgi:hypothetical protein